MKNRWISWVFTGLAGVLAWASAGTGAAQATEQEAGISGSSIARAETDGAGAGKESPWGSTTANLSLATDYVFRGQTLTGHQPAVQGGLDWTHPTGIYLGAWGSNVRIPNSEASLELDFYGGYTYSFSSSMSLSLGGMFYSYYRGAEGNTFEVPLGLTYGNFKLGLSYSPHWGGWDADSAWYLSGSWSRKLIWQTTLALGAGYSVFAPSLGFDDYADFHLGLSRDVLGVTCDLSGYMVSHRQFDGADDPQAVLTLSKSI